MLQVSILASRALLALVFAISGVAKLTTRARTRDSFVEFGVPSRLAGIGAILLVGAELAVAGLLLPVASAWYGGLGALALLLVFSAAIAVNLALHRKPRCNCFGQLSATPIGWQTLARNLAFGVMAAIVVWGGRDPGTLTMLGWTHTLSRAGSVALAVSASNLILLIGMAALLAQVMRQHGRVLLRLEALEQGGGAKDGLRGSEDAVKAGLPLGTAAPSFELKNADGGRTSLDELLQEQKSVLLLFLHPECGPCQTLLPELPGWESKLREYWRIAVVAEGSAAENRAKFDPLGIGRVLLQESHEVSEHYQVWGTPAAVLIAPDGTIASYVAQGADAIRAMIGSLLVQRQRLGQDTKTIAMGDLAPDLRFESLWGEDVALSDLRERETLLLFWNPQCGFCEKMLPDLKAWETNAPPDAPQLLVISTGSASENRAMGLRSMVVSDIGSRAANVFAAHGTPMAVFLDSDGRVASRVAAGAQEFFALANRGKESESAMDLALRRA